ncbi:hypothetical protein [Hubei permutotetra-like virus 3]|uniref:hypothetical protein n=1 Tax=Hubei permutotetra-like virus 3 TaxID=1923077 RepID=UPI00090C9998|nr:hypothetical protein [Hubei permutotetra-like virus 3]APG76949.1 hypothetical protein [Hubei permutotetra-like virus 3]
MPAQLRKRNVKTARMVVAPAKRKRSPRDQGTKLLNQARDGLRMTAKAIVHPLSIVMFIFSLYLFYNNAPLTNFATKLESSALLKPLGEFIKTHVLQVAGLVWIIPVTFIAARPAWAFLASLVSSIFVTEYLKTPTKYWEYAFLGISATMLLRARTGVQFFIAVLLVVLSLGLGLWGDELFAPPAGAPEEPPAVTPPSGS